MPTRIPHPSLLALLAAALVGGCVPVASKPPPVVPPAPRVPIPPRAQLATGSYTPTSSIEAHGARRLSLRTQALGLADFRFPEDLSELRRDLLDTLLDEGFRTVIDLSPAQSIEASYIHSAGGSESTLSGSMGELIYLAPVSRAQVVLVPEVLSLMQVRRQLEVAMEYEDDALNIYEADYATWQQQSSLLREDLRELEAEYRDQLGPPEWTGGRPFLVQLWENFGANTQTTAQKDFLRSLSDTRQGLDRTPTHPDELKKVEESGKGSQIVDLHAATLRLNLIEAHSGRLMTVVDISVESFDLPTLSAKLAVAAVEALEAR